MTSKHTPGPWEVRGKQSVRAGTAYIAKTNWRNGAADARLIAMAPRMYEALRLLKQNAPEEALIQAEAILNELEQNQ